MNLFSPVVQYWAKSPNISINLNKCLFSTYSFNKSNSPIKKYSTISFDELLLILNKEDIDN